MTYNGWTNYATWRVNLEMFDGMSPSDVYGGETPPDVWALENALREYAEEMLSGDSVAINFARAFMADVNWTEIARHRIEEYA